MRFIKFYATILNNIARYSIFLNTMQRARTGRHHTTSAGGESVRAFVPSPLPPKPPLQLDGALQQTLERATLALGRLDAVSALLPEPSLFIYAYIRKEAVLSSQIEGTQSTLSDLLRFELADAPGAPLDDVREVANYVAALEHGIARLRELPLCNRLLCEMHGILLRGGRGDKSAPGEFRRSQNWLGGTRPGNATHVPPPHTEVADCMAQLERFMNAGDDGLPALVRAALAHVQFETIHPFLDGNGRIGRLLIVLMLHRASVLREPLLYLSLYLKQRRARYYELLTEVRVSGDWEAWLEFFIDGARTTADGAVETCQQLLRLFADDRAAIEGQGRRAGSALRAHSALQQRPILSLPAIVAHTGLSYPAAAGAVELLTAHGITREITGKPRDRLFAYHKYLAVLNEGDE